MDEGQLRSMQESSEAAGLRVVGSPGVNADVVESLRAELRKAQIVQRALEAEVEQLQEENQVLRAELEKRVVKRAMPQKKVAAK